MDNKCPKCGKKLNVFYFKSECPECGCNMMYYNMEARLEEDSIKAEAEWDRFYKFLAKFKRKKEDENDETD